MLISSTAWPWICSGPPLAVKSPLIVPATPPPPMRRRQEDEAGLAVAQADRAVGRVAEAGDLDVGAATRVTFCPLAFVVESKTKSPLTLWPRIVTVICSPARRMYGPLGSVSVLVVPSPTLKISLTAAFVLLMPRLERAAEGERVAAEGDVDRDAELGRHAEVGDEDQAVAALELEAAVGLVAEHELQAEDADLHDLGAVGARGLLEHQTPPIEASPIASVTLPWTRRTVVAKSSVMLVRRPVGTVTARAPERFSAWAVGWPGTLALLISTVRSVAAIVTPGMPTSATDLAVAFSAK